MNIVNDSFVNKLEISLPYFLYLPNDYSNDSSKPWPIILYLHGAGERGNPDNLSKYGLIKYILSTSYFPFITLAPVCPKNDVWDMHYKSVMCLLDYIIDNFNIDKTKIYISGISMGGCGAWHYSIFDPSRFAAIIPICGCVANPKSVKALKNKPIWTAHGKKDNSILFEETSKIVDILKQEGTEIHFQVFEENGHEVCSLAYENQDLYQWMLKQEL